MDVQATIRVFIEKSGGVNKGCKKIAKRLNYEWQWEHIANVSRGAKPSDRLIRKLKALRPPKPPRKRYRLTIETDNETEYKQFESLTMERRLRAFRNEYKKG